MKNGTCMSGDMDDHVPYRFEPACSPHLAALLSGVTISLEHIRKKFARLTDKETITIVEGAGGVLTPLSETESMLDLMLHLRLPVVLVTSPRVGTLNHTLLTLEALAIKGIEPAGIVASNHCGMPEDYIYHDNVRFLKGSMPAAAFLEVGHHGECDDTVRKFCGRLNERL
jgi:dethiobiotin synthetase